MIKYYIFFVAIFKCILASYVKGKNWQKVFFAQSWSQKRESSSSKELKKRI